MRRLKGHVGEVAEMPNGEQGGEGCVMEGGAAVNFGEIRRGKNLEGRTEENVV